MWAGPAFLKHVSIRGFDYGISVKHTEYGLTFESILVEGQKRAGILNDSNVLALHGLTSTNNVPALHNSSAQGLILLIDAQLDGGSSGSSAVHNDAGQVYLGHS
jgi:hypothetical protein